MEQSETTFSQLGANARIEELNTEAQQIHQRHNRENRQRVSDQASVRAISNIAENDIGIWLLEYIVLR